MRNMKTRQLAPGYSSEVNTLDERGWNQSLLDFSDANIYQTWAYAATIAGQRNIGQLIVRRNGEIAALAQARVTKLPFLPIGIAYVYWGPLWRRNGSAEEIEVFRQAVRALRNEFVCRRGLALRLFPMLFDVDAPALLKVLEEELFDSMPRQTRGRTILMDVRPPLDALHAGMKAHWRRELKVAQKRGLELIEGTGDDLFGAFIQIYREMVSRKQFVEPNNIDQFRAIQSRLPEALKMRILLCKSGDEITSGLISSAIGNTAIYLFGATSNNGMKSRGSYFLQWRFLDWLKGQNTEIYNLNGINPEKNPGTYAFKNDLAGETGKDVHYLGRFEASAGGLNTVVIELAEKIRELRHAARAEKRPRPAAVVGESA